MNVSGWVLVDKPAGMSSRAVGGRIARMFGTKKFGHLGTLDPFATGILPIALGHATKMIPWIESVTDKTKSEKEYDFQIKWGIKTDTDDITGRIMSSCNDNLCTADSRLCGNDDGAIFPTFEQIENAIPRLIGDIWQTPPQYSAIHINGVRAYQLAVRGIAVEMPKRKVHIFDLKCDKAGQMDDFMYHVKCTAGTYVRSLAQDIAGLCGPEFICTTSAIRRTRTHGFYVKNAVTLDFLENMYNNDATSIGNYLLPADFGLDDILVLKLNVEQSDLFANGGFIDVPDITNVGPVRVFCANQFIGIGNISNQILKPQRILKDL